MKGKDSLGGAMVEPGALKTCPFCGVPVHGLAVIMECGSEDRNHFVQCKECGACGPLAMTNEGAMEKWDERADKPAEKF